jgi:YHS domain-containing protein
MVKDPVCKRSVDEKKTEAKLEHDGKTHYFCSWNCRSKFKADPDKYDPASKK